LTYAAAKALFREWALRGFSRHDVRCLDCGLAYGGDDWLDTSLSNEQWRLIHPAEGGILCANCIVRRASRLPRVIRMVTRIEFAEDVQ